MRELEERARPTIRKMVLGEPCVLGPVEQLAIAAWGTQVAMIGEYESGDDNIICQEQRDLFRKTVRPPAQWTLWVGAYKGLRHAFSINQGGSWELRLRTADGLGIDRGKAVVTVFVVGQLVCLSLYSTHAVPLAPYFTEPSLTKVWPIASPLLVWPTLSVGDLYIDGLQKHINGLFSFSLPPDWHSNRV